ncbi:MAG: extracellular solute-binding protein [Clostridia bacterium]|nr:extracellular solute-binding protein [Clostridia bacterium]
MKKSARIFALVLSALLACSSVACMKGGNNDDTVVSDGSEDVENVNAEDGVFSVPEGVAEGKTFSLYIANPDIKNSFIAEEETGDEFNDSVYERNRLVEEHTGVELNFVASTRTSNGADQGAETSQIRTWIQAGDNTYDAYLHVQHSGMPTLIEEGMFLDWNDIPYVNIENPWWYSNVQRDICFGDKIFCMTGDYNFKSFANSECLIFNKTLCDELELDYPYQLVFDGKWTHDKFLEYIRAAGKDLNGDGLLKIEDDRFGFSGWSPEVVSALFCGYGGATLRKDDNNLPVLNVDNETTYNVIDSMLEVFGDENAFIVKDKYGTEDRMFDEGRLMFNDSFLSAVPGTRKLEDIDVGFVPYPKLDEDQENYYSRTANISGLTYIPVTNADVNKTGAVLESLAYFSKDTILPTYFDIILTVKSTRDVESEQMIPIIRESSRFMDSVVGFSYQSIINANNGNTLSSMIAANSEAWQIKVDSLIETYSDDE